MNTTLCNCRRHAIAGAVDGERRRLLGLAALVALGGLGLGALTGCSDPAGTAQTLAPVEIDRSTSCELDGMLLADYPGPKAQVHYAGQAQPSFFCDTVELFSTLLAGEQVRAVRAVYVQDMGQADWNAPRGHWIDAKTALYVVGGKRHGSMGPTIGSFAQEADARKFAAEYGGRVLKFAEITADMVDLSGGALHDTRM
ncbi:NosL family protein [Acidovorax delafieldii 2AN]|uniref:NosL family protein n=1 Tax=Acidovorax delafieldii 2AN TaxID=573060 RepID=C5T722_ACIDE|nr:nitrous oxide reductase accessory protein NosL [Acidovorax delafieldii]EER59735.1 NosL family protein [Acidovorax delafieldii 2AN]